MNITYLSVNITKTFENMDVRFKYNLVNNYSLFVMGCMLQLINIT